jgi:hypothetical protein
VVVPAARRAPVEQRGAGAARTKQGTGLEIEEVAVFGRQRLAAELATLLIIRWGVVRTTRLRRQAPEARRG